MKLLTTLKLIMKLESVLSVLRTNSVDMAGAIPMFHDMQPCVLKSNGIPIAKKRKHLKIKK